MLSLRFAGMPLLFAITAGMSPPPRDVTPRAAAIPTLDSVDPHRLVVGGGAPQRITVSGTGFENAGHPNRDEYMHWQIRRDDGGWARCSRLLLDAAAICQTAGWANNSESLVIGGAYTARAGFIELRVFQGIAVDTETNPHNAPNPTEWSNVIRIPVVVPGNAPEISSLTPSSFPLEGDGSKFRMLINASNLDPTAVVVFRGDVAVAPEGMSDGAIQVTIPSVYRRTTPGEMSLTVRTDRGGHSAQKYFRFAAQQVEVLRNENIPVSKAPVMASDARGAGTVAPRVVRGAAGVGTRRSETCISGFVWREATPQDRACVTSEARAQAARQNAGALSRRIDNPPPNGPAPCKSGFVWREAVPGDAVCVTPAERTQTAEDTRLAASRVAP